jgi:hypothetical protein
LRGTNLALATIFVAGFTSIFVEIIVVLSFQIFYGYIYSMIGLIFTLFMLGLTMGAFIMQRIASEREISFKSLSLVQRFQVLYIIAFMIMIYALSQSTFSEDYIIIICSS